MTHTREGDSAAALFISQSRVLSYRIPGASGAGSSNFVVQLTGSTGHGDVVGVGESQPRWKRTGDDAGSAWKFIVEAVKRLEGRELTVKSPTAAIAHIRQLMEEFTQLAAERAVDPGVEKPFRGALLGIEMALLDAAAQAAECTMAQLLASAGPSGDQLNSTAENEGSVASYFSRLKVGTDPETFDEAVEEFTATELGTAQADSASQAQARIWLTSSGDLSLAEAKALMSTVQQKLTAESLTAEVFVTQLLDSSDDEGREEFATFLGTLAADQSSPITIRQVVGPSQVETPEEDQPQDTPRAQSAVVIRPAQAGGLLPALDIIDTWAQEHPEVALILGGMGGLSRISASALYQASIARESMAGVVNAHATVERSLPLTAAQHDPSHFGDVAADASSGSGGEDGEIQDDTGIEDPEEMDIADEDEDLISRGESRENDDIDLRIESLATAGNLGIGVGLSFLALVNDVENMETFPPLAEPEFEGMKPNVFSDVDHLHPLGARGSKGHLAEREALAFGLSTTRFSKGVFLASDGENEPVNFKWNRNPLVSGVALGLCTHKEASRLQLQRAGVPVPQGRTFSRGDIETARAFAARIGYPVVMKPAMGVRGIGVVANIEDESGLNEAYELMTASRLGDQDFIVEKHVHGKDYRIVVVGDRVVAAILREPASVVGDGEHTVAELLLNRNSARRRNPHLWARPPQYNTAAKYELRKQGLTIDSVPESGRTVRLGSTNSLSQGGESMAVLDEMHPSIVEACVKVVRSVPGMDYCGVDFLLEDHTKPLDEQEAGVCELNAHAAIGNCQYPMFGQPRPVARMVMHEVADRYGLDIAATPADQVALQVIVRGKVTQVGFRRWLQRRAREAGVSGWVRNVTEKSLETVLVGPTDATTSVVSSLINGPRRARPTSYEAKHIEAPEVEGFEVLPDRDRGLPPAGTAESNPLSKIWRRINAR